MTLRRVSPNALHLRLRLMLIGRSLLHLRLFLDQFRSLKTLPVKRNLSNAHRRIGLPVPAQLFILLLPLVMKDKNFRAAAFLHNLTDDSRSRFRFADLSFSARDR